MDPFDEFAMLIGYAEMVILSVFAVGKMARALVSWWGEHILRELKAVHAVTVLRRHLRELHREGKIGPFDVD